MGDIFIYTTARLGSYISLLPFIHWHANAYWIKPPPWDWSWEGGDRCMYRRHGSHACPVPASGWTSAVYMRCMHFEANSLTLLQAPRKSEVPCNKTRRGIKIQPMLLIKTVVNIDFQVTSCTSLLLFLPYFSLHGSLCTCSPYHLSPSHYTGWEMARGLLPKNSVSVTTWSLLSHITPSQ